MASVRLSRKVVTLKRRGSKEPRLFFVENDMPEETKPVTETPKAAKKKAAAAPLFRIRCELSNTERDINGVHFNDSADGRALESKIVTEEVAATFEGKPGFIILPQ